MGSRTRLQNYLKEDTTKSSDDLPSLSECFPGFQKAVDVIADADPTDGPLFNGAFEGAGAELRGILNGDVKPRTALVFAEWQRDHPDLPTVSTENLLDNALQSTASVLSGAISGALGLVFGGDADSKNNKRRAARIRQGIEKTYGNKRWVTEHLRPKEMSGKTALLLSKNGVPVATPVKAFDLINGTLGKIVSRQIANLNNYGRDLLDIYQWGLNLMDDGHEPQEVVNYLIRETDKSRVLFADGFFGPVLLGDKQFVFEDERGAMTNNSDHDPDDSLPALNANQVVDGAKQLVKHMAIVDNHWDKIRVPGVQISGPFWSWLSKSKVDGLSDLKERFDYKQEPGAQYKGVVAHLNLWSDYITEVSNWLHGQINIKQTSMEHLDMASPKRLASYLTPELTPLDTVSTEGIIDSITSMFSKLVKGTQRAILTPNPNGEAGSMVFIDKWVKENRPALLKTYGNLSWVEENLSSKNVRAPKLAAELSYKGKVFASPVEAMTALEKMILPWIKACSPKLEAYENKLDALEAEALKMVEAGTGHVDVAKWLLSKGKTVALPFPPGSMTPEFFGGVKFTVTRDLISDSRTSANYSTDSKELTALTAHQIVEATNMLLAQVDLTNSLWKDCPSAGSGCDAGVWEYLDYNDLEDDVDVDELWSIFYFQQTPESQDDMIYNPLFAWTQHLMSVARWLHSQLDKSKVSLEGAGSTPARLAKYFDHQPTQAAASDARVVLLGTVNSNWRDTLIPTLKCAFFNPIVDDWTPEAQAQEEMVKRTASAVLVTITPKQTGFYSFVELTDMAVRDPNRLFVCFLNDDEGTPWDEKNGKSIDAIREYLKNECGLTVYESLKDVADAINDEVPHISQNGEAGSGLTQ